MALKIKRTTREAEDIPLASTADIAFLLIVFFLAASALLEMRGVMIPLPKKDAPPMQVLRRDLFKIGVTAGGDLVHEDQVVDLDQLQRLMEEGLKANPGMIIVLRLHPDAPADRLPLVVRRVRLVGIERLSVGIDEKGGG